MPKKLAELLRRAGVPFESCTESQIAEWSGELHAAFLHKQVLRTDESALRVVKAAKTLAVLRAMPAAQREETLSGLSPTQRAALADELRIVEVAATRRLMGLPLVASKQHEEKPTAVAQKRLPLDERDGGGYKISAAQKSAREADTHDDLGYPRWGST